MMGGGQFRATVRAAFWAGLLLPFVAACGHSPRGPADIPPVYKIRNAPLPVPYPKPKPSYSARTSVAPSTARGPVRATQSVIVRKGDTLYAISRAHNIPVRDLIDANHMRPPYALAVGQVVRLPAANIHVVQKGETSYGISRQYGVTVSELMEANHIRSPYTLAIGQKLVLPGGADMKGATASAPTTTASSRYTPPPRRAKPHYRPPPSSGQGFIWPVSGQLASRFGPKAGGLHNDGINILAGKGTPVRAAEAGVVVYASNALEGYGNLLLLRHHGGWITAYAHNERILVRPGQQVAKGQVVARVGSTGGVQTPQLHFEIRKGRQVLDPLRYLRPQTAQSR